MKKIYFLILVSLILTSCQGYSITGGPGKVAPPSLMASTQRNRDLLKINSIYVAPVELDESVRKYDNAKVDFQGKLNEVINESVQLKVNYPEDENIINPSWRDYAEIARKTRSDAVLITKINSFIARHGTALGADEGATVNLTMEIIRVSDAVSVWQSNYHFKDQALSDNLFKIQDRLAGGKVQRWKTADELLLTGYRSALNDFSQKRLAEFSSGK